MGIGSPFFFLVWRLTRLGKALFVWVNSNELKLSNNRLGGNWNRNTLILIPIHYFGFVMLKSNTLIFLFVITYLVQLGNDKETLLHEFFQWLLQVRSALLTVYYLVCNIPTQLNTTQLDIFEELFSKMW